MMPNSMLQPSDPAECGAGQVIDNDKRPCDRFWRLMCITRSLPSAVTLPPGREGAFGSTRKRARKAAEEGRRGGPAALCLDGLCEPTFGTE